MRRLTTTLLAGITAVTLATAAAPAADQRPGAPAEPTYTFEMQPGDAETVTGTSPGGFYLGLGAVRDAGAPWPDCSNDVPGAFYCDSVLVSVTGGELDVDDEGVETFVAHLEFALTPDTPAGDYDIRLYESDEDGTIGEQVTATQEYFFDQPNESLKIRVRTSAEETTKWYLAVVDYWVAVGGFTMDVTVD